MSKCDHPWFGDESPAFTHRVDGQPPFPEAGSVMTGLSNRIGPAPNYGVPTGSVPRVTPTGPSPWRPMQNPVDLKHLGKLAEEAGELAQATARCIIQGIDGREPVTGKPNRQWLEEEIADVRANCLLVERRFGLDQQAIAVRTVRKMDYLEAWHRQAGEP